MIKISNEITVTKDSKCFNKVVEYCKSELVIDNPDYIKKQRLNKWLGNTPKKLNLYKMIDGNVILPFGEINRLWAILGDDKYTLDFADTNIKVSGNVNLFNYQKKAVAEVVKKKRGILVSPAGSGKTQMAISIIKEISQKTLWLTHTTDLLKQSKDRFEAYFKANVGTVTAGKVDIADVTFATVQTMANLDMTEYKDTFGLVIVDECHRVASTPTKMSQFGKVINTLKARHKIGLTATPHRADGMLRSMFAYLGEIVHEVPFEAVACNTVKAKVEVVETEFEVGIYSQCIGTDGTINYTTLISELAEHAARNRQIVSHLRKQEGSVLVLSDRVGQLKYLRQELGYGVVIDGKTNKKVREQRINDMREGKEKVMFASYKLAKEGLDIKILDTLYFATPVKDLAVVIQSVGRIERKCDGKGEPIVFDFVDSEVGMLDKMFKKRKAIYKKNNNVLTSI